MSIIHTELKTNNCSQIRYFLSFRGKQNGFLQIFAHSVGHIKNLHFFLCVFFFFSGMGRNSCNISTSHINILIFDRLPKKKRKERKKKKYKRKRKKKSKEKKEKKLSAYHHETSEISCELNKPRQRQKKKKKMKMTFALLKWFYFLIMKTVLMKRLRILELYPL